MTSLKIYILESVFPILNKVGEEDRKVVIVSPYLCSVLYYDMRVVETFSHLIKYPFNTYSNVDRSYLIVAVS